MPTRFRSTLPADPAGVAEALSAPRTIVVQPFDDGGEVPAECWSKWLAFLHAFFGFATRLAEPMRLSPDVAWRREPRLGRRQWLGEDILRQLAASRPADAVSYLGVTTRDIYPHPVFDFAFGQAAPERCVAVCSIARFGPPYCGDGPGDHQLERLRRCCRLLAHETAHTLGFDHCNRALCLMNAAGTLDQSDHRPLHLCPEGVRILQRLTGIDLNERDRLLAAFWADAGWPEEAQWLAAVGPREAL